MEKLKIMGILNVTPDSFSDGGQYNSVESSLRRVKEMVDDGVDIIDVGGYSTRPGHSEITIEEEIERVVPVIEAIKHIAPLISVDTFRSEVARAALDAGAHIINDQWRGTYDERILEVVKQYNVPIILMHNRTEMIPDDKDAMDEVINDLKDSIDLCKKYNICDDLIWLDPGIGFQKTRAQELSIMRQLDRLVELGYKVLLATSRKRFVNTLLDRPYDAYDRDEQTVATTIYGLTKGVYGVRVHNVSMNRKAVDAYQTLVGEDDG